MSLRGREPRRNTFETILAFVAGFLAVLFLGLGTLFLALRGASANIEFDSKSLGPGAHLTLHRLSLGLTLFALGVWFTILTRGLWQTRRYGRVMAWITLAVVAVIAIIVALP